MQCPKCRFENPEGKKFCRECGSDLILACPKCSSEILPSDKFCGVCRYDLRAGPSAVPDRPTDQKPAEEKKPLPSSDSARKYVTVLFSDMSGYTAMSEKLDPEEVKEIMGKIFGEISKAIPRYEGVIDKFIGDAVMALFGIPHSHEDDPVRAIKAAREIHEIVSSLSPQYEKRIGKPLAMHTGICTGLVVTGEMNLEKGTPGVLGDTINTASRLTSLAKPGEIVISPDTYHQAEGFFTFEPMEPTTVKGKAEPMRPYKVISTKEDPTKTHRLTGLRAELIGRKVEMAQLQEAVANLKQGKGSIFSIVGDAGTGKSRLIEEFKAGLDLNTIQWREGHAYAYSQNIPYFPLINLLSRAWQIQEGDSPEQVRRKVETGAGFLIGDRNDLIPYLGSLYSLKYPEIEKISPEYWKASLHEAIQLILANLCKRSSTIICIEDLHWADPSSIEILRHILSDIRYPVIFLCIYRPSFSLFTSHQAATVKSYHEIRIQDLSPGESQDMVESLLKSQDVPPEFKKFIQTKVEGNPFYLEEVINSLLETATLIHQDDKWLLTKPLSEVNIPSTVQGVISARLDRLEMETKRILQEASVIGRAFLYEILRRITELKEQIDRRLMGLERLDLIRTRSLQPDLEYIFKHALTQEVVYNGLLKGERQDIHEKIGQVMEELFRDRLPEFYEALAFHFKQGQSVTKAVEYLMKAGQKSFSRFALDESYHFHKEAYDLLSPRTDKYKAEDTLLIDLLNEWAIILIWRGANSELIKLFETHKGLAESGIGKERLGMFYSALGFALQAREQYAESYAYLSKALELGEETKSPKVTGYACFRLAGTCTQLGYLDEAIKYGERARDLSGDPGADIPLHRPAIALGNAYFLRGDIRKLRELGANLLDERRKGSDPRCLAVGEMTLGYSHCCAGDFQSAIEAFKAALQASIDPLLIQMATCLLGFAYLANGQYQEALSMSQEVMRFSDQYGAEFVGTPALSFMGFALTATGDLDRGLELVGRAEEIYLKTNRRCLYASMQISYGQLYLKIVEGEGPKSFSFMVKNIRSLVKLVPGAAGKAEEHFIKAIEVAGEIDARVLLAQAHLGLGLLHRAKGRTEKAKESISLSIEIFGEIGAGAFLKQAQEALAILG
jgi:class 3 adenylate cyclase/tetratricopeptide (TPR) repeat protein